MTSLIHPKVQVILSTYNGERFLEELLDSLLAQDYPNMCVLVRDDGSQDCTPYILQSFETSPYIEVECGQNLGVTASFFALLQNVADDAQYIAFCDQDDVWMKDKLSRAVLQLEKKVATNKPGMYCSRYVITDETQRVLGYSQIPVRGPSFENALVQNIATGCTVVINKKARLKVLGSLPQLQKVRMYDWWIYQVVSAMGTVIYDPRPSLFYRQHGQNVVGEKTSLVGKWYKRMVRFIRHGRLQLVTEQAQEFNRVFGSEISEEKKNVLNDFLYARTGLVNRLRYALNCGVHRQTILEDAILKALLIMNRV